MFISKKSFLVLVLVGCLLFTTACSSSSDNSQDSTVKNVSTSNTEALNEDAPKEDPKVNVEEQVLLDQDDIVITAKSLQQDDMFGPSLKVLIENNSAKGITVQIRDSSINGVMADAMFSCDVAANKKANDSIIFMSSDLEQAGIEIIKDIDLKFHIFDSESWDGILDSDTITIKTTADPGYVQVYDDSGKVVLDEKGFKIVMKRVNSEDSFWGADVYVYIENNTNVDATIQARDVSINGFMIDPIFSSDVMAGKKSYDTITFFESDLVDNDIKSIDDMELSFHIFQANGWDTIFDSQKVSVIFE